MKLLPTLFALAITLAPVSVSADLTPGSMDVQWDTGADDCTKYVHTPIQVHEYNPQTYILRENLCDTWEAPFMYLLIGGKQALLIDTGDVADPKFMPLGAMVMALLPGGEQTKLPLIVVHSHGHLDHREGDAQFANLPRVTLVGSDLAHVRAYFGFKEWPNGTAQVDLGGRIVDVLPAPGHHPAHVVYYDRNTGLLFSGDMLMPARLLVDDYKAYVASAQRLADFLKDKSVSHVLGGHIEKDSHGGLLDWESTSHPDEAPLPLTKADVLALPVALQTFNGFYTQTGSFVIENPIHNLMVFGGMALLILLSLGYGVYRLIWRWRRRLKR